MGCPVPDRNVLNQTGQEIVEGGASWARQERISWGTVDRRKGTPSGA